MSIALRKSEAQYINPYQAWAIIVVAALIFMAAGTLIGKAFFWNYEAGVNSALAKQQKVAVDRTKSDPKSPANWVNLGWVYFQQGQYNQALAQYKKAMDLDPNYYPAHYNLGLAYMQVKKYDLAAESLKKAVSIEKKSGAAYLNLGVSYNQLGKYDEAIKILQQAYKFNPGSVDVLYQIGVSYEKAGRKADALYQYKAALGFDPNYKPAKEGLARLK